MNDRPSAPKPPQAVPALARARPQAIAAAARPESAPRSSGPRRLSPEEELEVLIRARYPIIYVVSWEEERVERCLRKIATARSKQLFVWTVTQGIVKSGAEAQRTKSGTGNTADPLAALDSVVQQIDPAIFLFQGFSSLVHRSI